MTAAAMAGLRSRPRNPIVLAALALFVAGAVAIIVGWFGISGTLDPGKQLPYLISGGVGGLFFVGIGGALLISVELGSLRGELQKRSEALDSVRTELEQLHDLQTAVLAAVERSASAAVAASGRRRTTPRSTTS